MPEARAFCASRVINSSTFLPTIIIRSASSSMTTTMYGSGTRSWIWLWSIVGSLAAFALVCVLGTLTFGAIGLLIASRARTLEGASGLMNVVMLPMWVASGVFFAATNFPNAVQPLVQALPLTAAVDAMRMNMLQGSGVAAMAGELGIMAAWLVLSFVLALRLFRWR